VEADQPPEEETPAAWRVTFEYDGEDVTVVAKERVAMLAPPDDEPLVSKDASGYWVEVRDDDDAVVYRQVIHNPIQTDLEVFPEDPSEPMHRVPVAHPRGVFQVVVPDLPEGRTAVLHGHASRQALREESPKPMAEFRLEEQKPPPRYAQ